MAARVSTQDASSARLVALDRACCVALLAAVDIGRLGVVDDDGNPVVLPISYLVVGDVDEFRVVVRTRPGNVLDRPDRPACLEIDGVDAGHAGGWSVLVRGLLRPIEPSDAVDPHPLFADDRDAWLVLEPTVITGRRLVAAEQHWAFDSAGYL